MAAYTTPDPAELAALCRRLGLNAPTALAPVAAGVENSTWLLTCAAHSAQDAVEEWVLTIVERGDAGELRFTTALCAALHQAGLPVPPPRADAGGARVHRLSGKPALVTPRAPGRHQLDPGAAHCRAIGDFLGRMHRQPAPPAVPPRANPFGRGWLEGAIRHLETRLDAADRALLAAQLDTYRSLEAADALPRGPIHADLFRDNALFVGRRLRAVIDFNSACLDWLLLDVAIALHDWAGTADGGFDARRAAALLTACAARRPFTAAELTAWRDLLGIAATRFWVSRELAQLDTPPEMTGRGHKDPGEFRARLLACRRGLNLPELPQARRGERAIDR